MRGYSQYCPVARASEVLAERWTPIIVRNVLLWCPHPQRDRRRLERAGIIEIRPRPNGQFRCMSHAVGPRPVAGAEHTW